MSSFSKSNHSLSTAESYASAVESIDDDYKTPTNSQKSIDDKVATEFVDDAHTPNTVSKEAVALDMSLSPTLGDSKQLSGKNNFESDVNSTENTGDSELDSSLNQYRADNDDDDVDTFKEKLTKQRTNQEILDDELDVELERIKTQVSKISRVLTHHTEQLSESSETESEGYDPKQMEWDGPDDPGNPFNWPSWKKWYCTITIGFLCLVITLGSSIYVDALPEMMVKWGISQTLGLAGLTFYLLGLALGPAIAAPISELFGRKVVYCSTLPVSMLFIMGVGLSKHIRETLVLRFFAGFTASAALAIGGGTISDIWRVHEIGLAMTIFCLAPLAGPVIGPIIGGFAAEHYVSDDPNTIGGLRWTMWINLFFGAAVFIPVYIMPETYKAIIMKRRIKKRGLKMKKGPPLLQFLLVIGFVTLLRPLEMLVVEPIVLVFSIYTAFIFAVLFGFFEAFPVIFRGQYGMSLGVSGLPFLGVGIGLLIGACTYLLINKYVFFKTHKDGYVGMKDKDGNPMKPTPESRLLPCKVGSLALAPSLFWLGWTGRASIHWMCPIAAALPFGFALILIFFSILTYFSMVYPPLSVASALAANNLLRYVISSVFPLFTVQMMDNLGIDWGCSVFAFIALALVPVPWIFDKFGPALRKKSKYGWFALMKQQQAAKEKANQV